MYHQVVEGRPPNIHAVSAEAFAQQLDWLRQSGYRSVYVDDSQGVREKAVALTFDDGYLDFLTVASPILREYGFAAEVFLIAGLMGKSRHWPDGDDTSCPRFLDWLQARELVQTEVRLGSHTLTHPNLAALPLAAAKAELNESRRLIEQETGAPVVALSYPYGGEDRQIRRLAREAGYRLACAGPAGYVGAPGADVYRLNRVTVLATDSLRDFAEKVQGSLRRRIAWHVRQLRSRLRQRAH